MILHKQELDLRGNSVLRGNNVNLTGRFDEMAYDGVADIVKHCPKDPRPRASMSWTGTQTMDELDRAVADGNPAWVRKMQQMVAQIELPDGMMRPESQRRRRRVRGDHGNELDIHRVYQGRSDVAWDRTEMESVPTLGNKLVHICVHVSGSGGIEAADFMWRGAAVIRIYDALVRMGKSVAVTVYYLHDRGFADGGSGAVSCRVKNYGEPLSEEKLAALVSAGFFRSYLMHRGNAAHPEKRAMRESYGYPLEDYRLRPWHARQDEAVGGTTVLIGHCFNKTQADHVVQNFVKQYVNNEEGKALTAKELLVAL